MKNHWLDEVKRRLAEESAQPTDVRFDRLRAMGIIDDGGKVTGHLRRWDTFLAITEVKRADNAETIAVFRCLKPVFGMPGAATIDVSRESMLEYLKQQKKVITARWDETLTIWRECCEVRLSPKGFVRTDLTDDLGDHLGNLPEIKQANS